MMEEWSVWIFSLMFCAVAAGTFVQGSVGFGFGLVTVPLLSAVAPTHVPVTLMLLAFPLTIGMAIGERGAINVGSFVRLSAGKLPGTLLGVLLLTLIPAERLATLFGSIVIVMALLSATNLHLRITPLREVIAGAASGTMGGAAAIGGPILATFYSRRSGPEIRSTLALVFIGGLLMAFGGHAFAGRVSLSNFGLAAQLIPAVAIGLLLSKLTSGAVDGRWLRPIVLLFAVVSGVWVVLDSL